RHDKVLEMRPGCNGQYNLTPSLCLDKAVTVPRQHPFGDPPAYLKRDIACAVVVHQVIVLVAVCRHVGSVLQRLAKPVKFRRGEVASTGKCLEIPVEPGEVVEHE